MLQDIQPLPPDFPMERFRERQSLSQSELGRLAGMPQVHISHIETGKVSPRLDTLQDLARILGYEIMFVPRQLVPSVRAMIEDDFHPPTTDEERPLYALTDNEL